MSYDLLKNVSSLTLIKPSILNSIINIEEDCICDYTLDIYESDDDIIEIDIGIGTLYINIIEDELTYKFVPSKRLEKKIINTINSGESYLEKDIESKLNSKLFNTYKELL